MINSFEAMLDKASQIASNGASLRNASERIGLAKGWNMRPSHRPHRVVPSAIVKVIPVTIDYT